MKNLIAIILIIISAGAFFVYIDPQYKEIQIITAERAQYQTALDQVQELTTIRDEFLDKYRSLSQDDLAKMDKMLPNNIDSIRLVMGLDGIANKYGVIIKNIKVSDPSKNQQQNTNLGEVNKPFNSMDVSFGFKATYDSFQNFIQALETNLRLTDIIAISVNADDTGINSYDMTVRTYWSK